MINVRPCGYPEIQPLRELYRDDSHFQIIHYSFLPRGLADPYLILIGGEVAGYGAIANKYCPGRIVEFYAMPEFRRLRLAMFRELLNATRATEIEAQTNSPVMLQMIFDCSTDVKPEKILFHDGFSSTLESPGVEFKQSAGEEEYVLVSPSGEAVAKGGFLTHYNPPFADIYMEVSADARRRGFGSYLVQELKRACYAAGKKPAARCDPENVASRRTLERAGLVVCGHMLVGHVT